MEIQKNPNQVTNFFGQQKNWVQVVSGASGASPFIVIENLLQKRLITLKATVKKVISMDWFRLMTKKTSVKVISIIKLRFCIFLIPSGKSFGASF